MIGPRDNEINPVREEIEQRYIGASCRRLGQGTREWGQGVAKTSALAIPPSDGVNAVPRENETDLTPSRRIHSATSPSFRSRWVAQISPSPSGSVANSTDERTMRRCSARTARHHTLRA